MRRGAPGSRAGGLILRPEAQTLQSLRYVILDSSLEPCLLSPPKQAGPRTDPPEPQSSPRLTPDSGPFHRCPPTHWLNPPSSGAVLVIILDLDPCAIHRTQTRTPFL